MEPLSSHSGVISSTAPSCDVALPRCSARTALFLLVVLLHHQPRLQLSVRSSTSSQLRS